MSKFVVRFMLSFGTTLLLCALAITCVAHADGPGGPGTVPGTKCGDFDSPTFSCLNYNNKCTSAVWCVIISKGGAVYECECHP
jgi:hypothetical protein